LNGDEFLFELGKDGNPAFSPIQYEPDGKVILSYLFEEDSFTIQPKFSSNELNGLPIKMLDESTPVVLVGQRLINLHKNLKPSRLKPFLEKTRNVVQNKFIKDYAIKFILNDLQNEVANLSGKVKAEKIPFKLIDVYFSFAFEGSQLDLFEGQKVELKLPEKLTVQIKFIYGDWAAKYDDPTSKFLFHNEEIPHFQQIIRDEILERKLRMQIESLFDLRLSKGEDKITFVHLRDTILDKLKDLGPQYQFRFSNEFRQINLKTSKVNIKVLEKIDYFQIEGSIDWDGHSIDIHELRKNFELDNGWLKRGDQYWAVGEEDQAFLNQLFMLSSSSKEFTVSKNTARAIKLENAEIFAQKWEYVTTLLQDNQSNKVEDLTGFCPNFTFRDYQQKGFEWLLSLAESDLGGILADDMGLGKTFQAAAFLLYQIRQKKETRPTLIVLPSTLIFNWQHELKRFAPDFKVLVHAGPGRLKSLAGMEKVFNVILVSYQTLARDISMLEKEKYGTVIADEAHNLKNPDTLSYKSIEKLKAERIFLLTGTPMQNSPVDLWALSELCNPGLLTKKIKPQSIQKADNPTKFAEKLNLLQNLVKPFLLRRTKQNVLTELPEKTISTVLCTMSDEQELEYLAHNQAIASEISDISLPPGPAKSVKILKALTTLRQLANHPRLIGLDENSKSGKFDLVTEKLNEVLSAGHKVLVFSSFVKHLQLFTEYMDVEKIKYSLLTGQTKDREKQVEQFKNQTDRNVFFISLKAGGTGLNLVEASYVFLLDPWWNPASEAQAMDRVYRIGQKNAVTVYKFITSNTVEEKIIQLQSQKQTIADQLLTGADMQQSSFTIEMLQEILMTKV
jgi:SNF2 family DNA or RNA helicase